MCTGRRLGHEGRAAEPMTCPPDAYDSGVGLMILGVGHEHVASWTISAV
ncbi:hypothetical protein [Nonomuraea solani]|nr:hypothetical protein [Nonomuraea solani]